jgi:hypothetical protein
LVAQGKAENVLGGPMIYLAVGMQFVNPDGTATEEDFEAFLDRVIEELDNLGSEADVTSSLARMDAEFGVGIESETFEDATASFLTALRTALHAAECNTADWPEFEAHERVIRELDPA